MKMRMLFVALVIVLLAVSATKGVEAADPPAPSPASDAAVFVPGVLASVAAFALGFLFF